MPFLDWLSRFSRQLRRFGQSQRWAKCAIDGMDVPWTGRIATATGAPLDLYYCYCCGSGDALWNGSQLGTAPAFRFIWDDEHRSWQLRRVQGNLDERSIIQFLNAVAPNGNVLQRRALHHS